MALFRRKSSSQEASAPPMQPPDEFGEQAQLAYGSQEFAQALELYGSAIDKLHTMYVMGDCKYRQPSRDDAYIVNGFVSALGATKATDPSRNLSQAESPISFLVQIADSASERGLDPSLYVDAANAASSELRR